MKSLKIKYRQQELDMVIEASLKYPVVVQTKILDVINAGVFKSFLPLEYKIKSDKAALLKCYAKNLGSLGSYLKSYLSAQDFFEVVLKLVRIIRFCEDNLLNANNIELNPDAMFIDAQSKEIKCIYWPVVNNQSYISQKDFFCNLINLANINSKDSVSLVKYRNFFDGLLPFSLNNFEKLINELQGKKVHTADISPSSNLLNEDGTSTKLNTFGEEKKNLSYDPVSQATSAKVVSASVSAINSNLSLKRVSNEEMIFVTSVVYKIGKSENDNDYVINDNRAISRQHAEIRIKGNQYYIVDCNSTNGVKINGKKIKPSVDFKIKHGDMILLADELFEVM